MSYVTHRPKQQQKSPVRQAAKKMIQEKN